MSIRCTLFSASLKKAEETIDSILNQAANGIFRDSYLLEKGQKIFSSKIPGNKILAPDNTPSVLEFERKVVPLDPHYNNNPFKGKQLR